MKRTSRGVYINEKSALFVAAFFVLLLLAAVTQYFFGYSIYPVLKWLPRVLFAAAWVCLLLSFVAFKKSKQGVSRSAAKAGRKRRRR